MSSQLLDKRKSRIKQRAVVRLPDPHPGNARIIASGSKNSSPINQDFFAVTGIEQNYPLVDSFAYEKT
jgi:hypothetical protein